MGKRERRRGREIYKERERERELFRGWNSFRMGSLENSHGFFFLELGDDENEDGQGL